MHAKQDTLDKLDDATTELMTGEGDAVMLMLGDSFMECEEEYATEYCERQQEVHETLPCFARAVAVPAGAFLFRTVWCG